MVIEAIPFKNIRDYAIADSFLITAAEGGMEVKKGAARTRAKKKEQFGAGAAGADVAGPI